MYEWDADGNRVSFTSSTGGTDYFVYDPTAGIPAVVEEVDSGGSVYYIREPGGELIARVDGEEVSYYHFDALGSTRLITDDSGDVTDTYTYDAWGRQIDHTGSTAQPYRFVGQLGYYSHYQDANLFTENDWQLLHLGVRFYDAGLGRFTQVDPAESGIHWYAYAANYPTAVVDPTGLYGWYDFVWHYFFGNGERVDLGRVGLLDTYVGCPAVQLVMGVFGQLIKEEATKLAKDACKGKCKNATPATVKLDFQVDHTYHTDVTWGQGEGLYSLGNSYPTAHADCKLTAHCLSQTFEYTCKSHWKLRDLFEYPLGKKRGNLGGTPYEIWGDWDKSYSGEGSF